MLRRWIYIMVGAVVGAAFAVAVASTENVDPGWIGFLLYYAPAMPLMIFSAPFVFTGASMKSGGVSDVMYAAPIFAWAVIGGLIGMRTYHARHRDTAKPLRIWRVILVVFLLYLAAGGTIVAYLAHRQHVMAYRSVTVAEVSQRSMLEFPSEARLTDSALQEDMVLRELWARIEMPHSEITAFVKQNKLSDEAAFVYGPRGEAVDRLPWYKPLSGKKVKYCGLYDTTGVGTAVFINKDDPSRAVIYIYASKSKH